MIRFALRKPIAIMVVVLAIAFFSYNSVKKINVDIFPEVELPAIYISMSYGGLSPAYMDGFMANEFQKVLLFVSGVKNIDFKGMLDNKNFLDVLMFIERFKYFLKKYIDPSNLA